MHVTKPEASIQYEAGHKNTLMEKLITFGPSKYYVFEEVEVEGLRGKGV